MWPAWVAAVVITALVVAVAMLLTSRAPAHPRALLLGLNLGPNLAITGSLSAILWLQVARRGGAHSSVGRYTRIGLVLVPMTVGAAMIGLAVFAPHGL